MSVCKAEVSIQTTVTGTDDNRATADALNQWFAALLQGELDCWGHQEAHRGLGFRPYRRGKNRCPRCGLPTKLSTVKISCE